MLDVQNWFSQSITHVVYLPISAQATVLPPGRAQLLDLRELATVGLSCASCSSAVRALWGGLAALAPPKSWNGWYAQSPGAWAIRGAAAGVPTCWGACPARRLQQSCCCSMQCLHWCLARIMCSFNRGLCLGPHLRSQPRHAWPFRRARFVRPYVRPSLYSAVLVPASAAMWRCCECWLDSMQRACFPLPRRGRFHTTRGLVALKITKTEYTSVYGGLQACGRGMPQFKWGRML